MNNKFELSTDVLVLGSGPSGFAPHIMPLKTVQGLF